MRMAGARLMLPQASLWPTHFQRMAKLSQAPEQKAWMEREQKGAGGVRSFPPAFLPTRPGDSSARPKWLLPPASPLGLGGPFPPFLTWGAAKPKSHEARGPVASALVKAVPASFGDPKISLRVSRKHASGKQHPAKGCYSISNRLNGAEEASS